MSAGIYTTGNIVVDCLVRPVENMPPWGTSSRVESISLHLGGNGAATAYAAALLGAPTKLAGAVGRDLQGEFALSRLQAAGVDVSAVRVIDEVETAATVGLVNREGQRLFFHEPGASRVLAANDIPFDADVIQGCSYFHFGSVFALPRVRKQASLIVERARDAGLQISLDTSWDSEGRWMEDFRPLCGGIDLLFINIEEAQMMAGCRVPAEIADFFQKRGVRTVIVKLAERGCSVFSEHESFDLPAFEVEAVDSTGAGDSFCGAFLAGLCRGFDLRESAQLANAAGALSVRCMGGTDGVLNYDATRAWIETASSSTA